jgi:hypothetical protein
MQFGFATEAKDFNQTVNDVRFPLET